MGKLKSWFWLKLLIIAIIIFGIVNVFLLITSTSVAPNQTEQKEKVEFATNNPETKNQLLPTTFKLKVPFTSQAPTANWDQLHNEACEEASAIMANAYFQKITSLPAKNVEQEIDKLTLWQQQNFGYNLSITTEETKTMLEQVYGLKTEIQGISEHIIKEALNNNKLVILPSNGQLLGNPNFKSPGPIYHMLVITGYDENNFITNDPGTRKGEGYKYSYGTLEAANGSYKHQLKSVDLTQKNILIISN